MEVEVSSRSPLPNDFDIAPAKFYAPAATSKPTEPPDSDRGRKSALDSLLGAARRVEEALLRARLQREVTPELDAEIATMTKARYVFERALGPVVHQLKCDPEPFNAVKRGLKFCEVRKFDRDFRVGDILILSSYDREKKVFTGERLRVEVTHIVPPGEYGLPEDVGVLSIEVTIETI